MQTRIAGYDFARSLALFGLVAANFSHSIDHTGSHLLDTLIEGGVTTTFFVLGGVGISLLKQRDQRTNAAHRSADTQKRLIKRAASLLVVGISLNLIWHTNFLCRYSICIAIGALLLIASNRWLWLLAFVFVAIFIVLMFLIFDYSESFRNWEAWSDSDPWTVEGIVFSLYVNGFRWIFFWIAVLLIGMWLGRKEVHFRRLPRAVLFSGIAVALVSACTPWLLIHYVPGLISGYPPSISDRFSRVIGMVFMPLYFLGTCGTAIAIIGGSLMLIEKYPDARWTKPFITTGQLALTLYVAHLVIGRGLLGVLGILENQTLPFAIGSAVIFCICAVIFSHFWTKRFQRGPLEWAMRRITG